MIGFGCTTLQLKTAQTNFERQPVLRLTGSKLVRKEIIYNEESENISSIRTGMKLGSEKFHKVGEETLEQIGSWPSMALGILSERQEVRAVRVIGHNEKQSFGYHSLEVLGKTSPLNGDDKTMNSHKESRDKVQPIMSIMFSNSHPEAIFGVMQKLNIEGLIEGALYLFSILHYGEPTTASKTTEM